MRKLAVTFAFMLCCLFTFAQESYQDVVYLKNGSVIRGMIIEQVPNKSLKIQTADRSVFVYQIDEVEKMTKELNQAQVTAPKVKKESKSGYFLHLENSVGIGVGQYGMDMVKFSVINGYRFNQYLSLGAGIGLKQGSISDDLFDSDNAYLPIFTNFRVNFTNKKITPYFSLDLGSVFNLTEDDDEPELLFSPSIGVKFKFTQRMGLNVGMGYELQSVKCYKPSEYDYSCYSSDETSGTICFNVGFTF
ncbi:outer membrane beta-barrel protein [uncultured Acetobacteroides sp.]|uniref:outer membrane beta-barrel protein n=1 Tax=uncultured Acetobacteroides sp. TaxID=1760811 RepID=UPI0029F45AAC|nr:outer membrane beta-barrel protein [uncultured Acetobacteroides sp.]